jgi:two-component system sensor histidine kinase TctE
VSGAYSLRRRLLLGLLVALAAIAAAAVADSWREAQQTAAQVSDRVLAGSILAIAERVIVAEDGSLEVDVPYVALEMLTSSAQDRVFYRVDGPAGFITGYNALPTVAVTGSEISYDDRSFHGEPIRVGSLQRAASSGVSSIPFTVTVAETTIARGILARSLLVQATLRLAVLIVAAAAIVWLAVTLSLRPLYRLRSAIDERSPSDLSPISQTVPREVESLVETVNSFMSRLGSAIGALRHFTGNASHQLRTPMTIVRTQLALARRAETDQQRVAAIDKADVAIEHAERVLAQLLLLARIDEAVSDRTKFELVDLAVLAQTIAADQVPAANAVGIDLGYEGAEHALVRADPMLLGELIGNLIANAVAYAGAGAEATIRVLESGATVIMTVADNGEGVAATKVAHLGQRFSREYANKPGQGLGLAIVREIAELFAGVAEIKSDTAKGFEVTIGFPNARNSLG